MLKVLNHSVSSEIMRYRRAILAYQIGISGVLPAGTDSWHAQFDAGLLFCDKGQIFIKIMAFTYYGCNQCGHQALKSIFQGDKYY